MKLESWLSAACLASTVAAVGPAAPGKPARPPGQPERISSWKWTNPFFSETQLAKYDTSCTVEKTFPAREYLLDDVSEPPPMGLKPYMDALKKLFSDRKYPGSWDGVDPHGYDRNLLQMRYTDVPIKVREWIEAQDRDPDSKFKGLFAVYKVPTDGSKVNETVPVGDMPIPPELRELDADKTVLFAPGALYEILPLWVGEGSECPETLLDLTKYSPKLADNSVVAYPVKKMKARRREGKRDMEFTIKAQFVKAKPVTESSETDKAASDTATKEDAKKEDVKEDANKQESKSQESDRDEL